MDTQFWTMVSEWLWDEVEGEALTTPPTEVASPVGNCEPTVVVVLPILSPV